jgi:hypothetical protein
MVARGTIVEKLEDFDIGEFSTFGDSFFDSSPLGSCGLD